MAPFSFLSLGANLLIGRSLGLFSNGSFARCSCVVSSVKNLSTTAGDPPKRPLTAYMRYVVQQRPVLSRQYPDIKVVDAIRKIAQQWRILSPDQKRPFVDASLVAREQYKQAMERYQARLTPAQTAALAEERRQKVAKRKAMRKRKELNNLGKPKRPRTSFNIFMAEHFEEAKGATVQAKLKFLLEDWDSLYISQKQIYVQLAEDDKVRYKNEIKSWEEHMKEIGRDDLVRRNARTPKKMTETGKITSKAKVLKTAKASAKTSTIKKNATKKKTVRSTKKA